MATIACKNANAVSVRKVCEENLGKIISRDFPKISFTATTVGSESPEGDIMFYSLSFLSRVLNVKSGSPINKEKKDISKIFSQFIRARLLQRVLQL